jgi:transcriptional regulator with XRE-family HTH domain
MPQFCRGCGIAIALRRSILQGMAATRSTSHPAERSGPALKRARHAYGLTAAEIARAMGVSPQRAYAIEMYARCSEQLVVRYERALRIAQHARLRRWQRRDELQDMDAAVPQRETAGVSTLPAASEVSRASGEPRS